jgi:hypothetical protein
MPYARHSPYQLCFRETENLVNPNLQETVTQNISDVERFSIDNTSDVGYIYIIARGATRWRSPINQDWSSSMVIADVNSKDMKRAAERATCRPCKVRMIQRRLFEVKNDRGSVYNVRYGVTVNSGKVVASCNCKGGQANLLCYHVAVSIPLYFYTNA